MSGFDLAAQASAGAIATIDLDLIVANWRALQARLRPGARAMAVVKADAYGLGAPAVTRALLGAGCRRFGVATLEEGLTLRPLLPGAEIIAFAGPFPGAAADFAAHDLIPALNSREQIVAWSALARAQARKLPAALHIDTGMNRLGLTMDDARAIAGERDLLAPLDVILVMSHLARAEETDVALNSEQLVAFQSARALYPGIPGSLAASSGIFLGPDWHQDWARPGAALYGINPLLDKPNPMAQVLMLQGRIVQVRDVDEGWTVGYGATWRAPGKARLAVVSIGYADGFLRTLSNRGSACLGETRVSLVGRVSMDLAVFDVTKASATLVHPGALVELIGPSNPVDDVAARAGTIAYELMTRLGPRIHRVYRGGVTE